MIQGRAGCRADRLSSQDGHGVAWHQGGGAGGPGPGAVLRDGPGGLRSSGGACGPAGLQGRREPSGPGQALARAGPEAAARSRGAAAHLRTCGRAAGALPLR